MASVKKIIRKWNFPQIGRPSKTNLNTQLSTLTNSRPCKPRCVARPFDGHLTLIDRSTWRDGAFNRADSRARQIARSLTRVRCIICGSSTQKPMNGLWLCMLHLQGGSVRIPPSRIIHPGTTTMSFALAHAWHAGWYPAFQRLTSPTWVISLSFRDVDSRGTSRSETAFLCF